MGFGRNNIPVKMKCMAIPRKIVANHVNIYKFSETNKLMLLPPRLLLIFTTTLSSITKLDGNLVYMWYVCIRESESINIRDETGSAQVQAQNGHSGLGQSKSYICSQIK